MPACVCRLKKEIERERNNDVSTRFVRFQSRLTFFLKKMKSNCKKPNLVFVVYLMILISFLLSFFYSPKTKKKNQKSVFLLFPTSHYFTRTHIHRERKTKKENFLLERYWGRERGCIVSSNGRAWVNRYTISISSFNIGQHNRLAIGIIRTYKREEAIEILTKVEFNK